MYSIHCIVHRVDLYHPFRISNRLHTNSKVQSLSSGGGVVLPKERERKRERERERESYHRQSTVVGD